MGTRSLTKVIETYKEEKTGKQKKNTLLVMYRQYDGYPSGMGADLVEFLNGTKVVNGLGIDDINSKRVFNGIGCLAAQLVAHFKNGAGGIYIVGINQKDCGQDYEYEIIVDEETQNITLRCIEVGYVGKKRNGEDVYINKRRTLFEGKPENFIEAVAEYN